MIVWRKMPLVMTFLKSYLGLLVGFVIGFSPFLAFEARHAFPNTRAIFGFIFSDTVTKSAQTHISYIGVVQEIFFRVFGRLILNYPTPDLASRFSSTILE